MLRVYKENENKIRMKWAQLSEVLLLWLFLFICFSFFLLFSYSKREGKERKEKSRLGHGEYHLIFFSCSFLWPWLSLAKRSFCLDPCVYVILFFIYFKISTWATQIQSLAPRPTTRQSRRRASCVPTSPSPPSYVLVTPFSVRLLACLRYYDPSPRSLGREFRHRGRWSLTWREKSS